MPDVWKRGKTEDPRIDRAVSIIAEQVADPSLSLAKLSQAVGVSESHFACTFKQDAGSSFREHLCNLRIEKAKDLLANSNEEIKAIAAAAGYTSPSYFARRFRKCVGMSPHEFRTACKNASLAHACMEVPEGNARIVLANARFVLLISL